MFMNELTGAFEAVLFASGEPVSMESMREILGIVPSSKQQAMNLTPAEE